MIVILELEPEIEEAFQKKAMVDGKDIQNYIEDSLKKIGFATVA